MTRLVLTINAQLGRTHLPYLRGHLRRAHRLLRAPLHELNVALVNDQRMASLHERYLMLSGPTDVLTFPIDLDSRGRALSGDVVICVPEARRRATLEQTTLRSELLLYAIHGLLHLCGHDDRTDRGFRRMHQLEDKILTQLGVGPVFARPLHQSAQKRARFPTVPGRPGKSGAAARVVSAARRAR